MFTFKPFVYLEIQMENILWSLSIYFLPIFIYWLRVASYELPAFLSFDRRFSISHQAQSAKRRKPAQIQFLSRKQKVIAAAPFIN